MTALLMTVSCQGGKTDKPVEDVTADSVEQTATDTIDTEEELVAETPMPRTADELFADFVFNFASNGKLQRQRIVFPLKVATPQGEHTISQRQWKTDHMFMQTDFYTLMVSSRKQLSLVNDTSVSNAVVERIDFTHHQVKQFFFGRQNGLWRMNRIVEQPLQQHRNASFLTFYEKFATDSVFQSKSLAEEVHFTGPDPDDDFSQMEGLITPDTWPAFTPMLPADVIYNMVFGQPDGGAHHMLFVVRGIANGQELEMSFARRGTKWILTSMMT